MAELAFEQTLDLGDYLSAFRRRRRLIILIAGIVFMLGLITAYLWPPTYQSASTILIEEQEIPIDLVRTTITSYAAQRIQVISQRVMTRSNLMEIIEKYNLYEKDLKKKTTEEVLFDMQEAINVDMITAEVMDPRTGRPRAATIAFTVGFEGDKPQLVLKVANELTTLYLNENLKTRTEKTEETYVFLTEEANRLSKEIAELENEMAAFKEKNANILPELKELNTQVLQRTENELASIDTQIRTLDENRIYLEGQLALLDPYGSGNVITPGERLESLRTQYITLSTRYSPDHPDVINTRREIVALERETGAIDFTAEQQKQLDILHTELALASEKYADEHPDIQKLKRQIAALEEALRNPAPAPRSQPSPAAADNPAYVTLQTRLEANKSERRSLEKRRTELLDKIADYEHRLMQTPQVEGEFRRISANLNNAMSRYQEIKAKQRTAEVAQELEKERKGEKFTLIEPAVEPEEPVSPNRPAIIFLSLVLALGAGFGAAAVTENMDSTVRGAKSLVALLDTAPLAIIPYQNNAAEIARKRSRRIIVAAGTIGGIIILLLLIHFLFSPLDVLWFRGVRKVDIMVGS